MQLERPLNSLLLSLSLAIVGISAQAEAPKPSATDNLLFRVQFAGTTALTANTNATYLTNFVHLPETAALGTQLVAQVSTLPARFLGIAPTNSKSKILQPLLADMLRAGFALELRGSASGVTEFALATKATNTAARWDDAWRDAGNGALSVRRTNGWTFVAGSKSNAVAALSALAGLQRTVTDLNLTAGNALQVELASSLVPGPIQRSVYGGFSRLKLSVTPADETLKIRGTATYAQDLPKLGSAAVIPADLVTEPAISFTMVRQPGDWLEPKSVLRRFLPNPVPDVAFFWGCETSGYQLFAAVPFLEQGSFNTDFGPALVNQLKPLANFINCDAVVLNTNQTCIQWGQVPFVTPRITQKKVGTNDYLMAELFPADISSTTGLTPALIERVSGKSNLALFDWEFTQARMDTWLRVGQLAIFLSKNRQLSGETPSWKWMIAAQKMLVSGGNTFTEITQTGSRELSLNRRAPLAFTSTELFWLANWLESPNFPAANFLMPMVE